jgi:Na+-transporting NADH:ubiquinone oxidoreductase subunit E
MPAIAVFFSATFTSNILLTNYLGMCSFLAVSKEIKTSLGLGAAVTVVTAATAVLNWIVYYGVLVPLKLTHLHVVVFIVVIAAFVQVAEMVIERVSDTLHAALGVYLPLIAVNCAILVACLFMVIREYSLIRTFAYGLGAGLGWLLAILAMAGIRQQKLARARIPRGLEGPGIALIIAGIMSLAFIGFNGMLSGN